VNLHPPYSQRFNFSWCQGRSAVGCAFSRSAEAAIMGTLKKIEDNIVKKAATKEVILLDHLFNYILKGKRYSFRTKYCSYNFNNCHF